MFGLFPRINDTRSRFIMVSLEIFRLHARHNDVRNAYATLSKVNQRYPDNPMLISRLGRYCLEIGRKPEAMSLFK